MRNDRQPPNARFLQRGLGTGNPRHRHRPLLAISRRRPQRAQDPNFKLKPKSAPGSEATMGGPPVPPPGPESVQGIEVGARCQVMPGKRRGCVQFVGEVEGLKAGYWVGVKFDEPLGHNDGTVKGKTIFQCTMHYGAFVRGEKVTTGDFPERDLLDSDDENENQEDCCNKPKEEEEEDEDEI